MTQEISNRELLASVQKENHFLAWDRTKPGRDIADAVDVFCTDEEDEEDPIFVKCRKLVRLEYVMTKVGE